MECKPASPPSPLSTPPSLGPPAGPPPSRPHRYPSLLHGLPAPLSTPNTELSASRYSGSHDTRLDLGLNHVCIPRLRQRHVERSLEQAQGFLCKARPGLFRERDGVGKRSRSWPHAAPGGPGPAPAPAGAPGPFREHGWGSLSGSRKSSLVALKFMWTLEKTTFLRMFVMRNHACEILNAFVIRD